MARVDDAKNVRINSANEEYGNYNNNHPTNGEEDDYDGTHIANYTKGLHHNKDTGVVINEDYEKLLGAVTTQNPNKFKDIPTGIDLNDKNKKYFKLVNPIAGLAFDMEGQDCEGLSIENSPPRIDKPEGAAEMAEVYWMALCRDVSFLEFDSNSKIKEAVDSLNKEFAGHGNWPKDDSNNLLSTSSIFRGNFEGDRIGPFVSQFLLKGHEDNVLGRKELDGFVKYGAASYDNKIVVGLKEKDFLTHYDSWLAVQNGEDRNLSLLGDDYHNLKNFYDSTPRFIHNMRGLASFVHFDKLYQAYLNALIYLTRLGEFNNDILDKGNPYKEEKPPQGFKGTPQTINELYKNQSGFGTFGAPHILSLLTEVASRALKAAWYQKWYVHRRFRPEAFGGLIHISKTANGKDYGKYINEKILNSDVLKKIADHNEEQNKKYDRQDDNPVPNGKFYLLPMAFPEGSPTHPSFPQGHATVAGACVTVLKAWVDENYVLENPVQANHDGTRLKHYNGNSNLTLGGELNKLAANIALGRCMAGVHFRSEYIEGVKLGEKVAIGILMDQRKTYLEEGYSLTLNGKYRFLSDKDFTISYDSNYNEHYENI